MSLEYIGCRAYWGRKGQRAAMCWKVTPVAFTASFVSERNADPYTCFENNHLT